MKNLFSIMFSQQWPIIRIGDNFTLLQPLHLIGWFTLNFCSSLFRWVFSVEKREYLSHRKKIFLEINSFVTSVIKMLLSRNFCKKSVRGKFWYFHTVPLSWSKCGYIRNCDFFFGEKSWKQLFLVTAPPPNPNDPPQKWHSYKMLVDPSIHRGVCVVIFFVKTKMFIVKMKNFSWKWRIFRESEEFFVEETQCSVEIYGFFALQNFTWNRFGWEISDQFWKASNISWNWFTKIKKRLISRNVSIFHSFWTSGITVWI